MSTSIEKVETASPPTALMNGFSTIRVYWSPERPGPVPSARLSTESSNRGFAATMPQSHAVRTATFRLGFEVGVACESLPTIASRQCLTCRLATHGKSLPIVARRRRVACASRFAIQANSEAAGRSAAGTLGHRSASRRARACCDRPVTDWDVAMVSLACLSGDRRLGG